MHRTLRKLLPDAIGASQWVFAINIDIRGFSTYSLSRDSVETAIYLKKAYIAILDRYYQFDGIFYKPTGDGLFLVVPFAESDFAEVSREVISESLRLIDDFGRLTENEPMIKFAVPQEVGIGISAGSASRLSSRGKTLDYAGKVLNQASRLMELARPSGLVFDESVASELLPKALLRRFVSDRVYLRGIAEQSSVGVYYLKKRTLIPETFRKPPAGEKWEKEEESATLRTFRSRSSFRHELKHEPLDRTRIEVEARYPKYRSSKRVAGVRSIYSPPHSYILQAETPIVTIDYTQLVKYLMTRGVRQADEVSIEIRYPRPAAEGDFGE